VFVFDINLCCLPEVRSFWGALCETLGTRLTLTPTAARETVRRENIETQRKWIAQLKLVNENCEQNWTRMQVRRFATKAAISAAAWLKAELAKPNGAYAIDAQDSASTQQRLTLLEDALPDSFFNIKTPNGIRDKQIVVEALAGRHDILITNNIATIDVIGLQPWIKTHAESFDLQTTILNPLVALEWLRETHQMPDDWLAHVTAKACINNPYDRGQAEDEIFALIDGLSHRGLDELQTHLRQALSDHGNLLSALETVKRNGRSKSSLAEDDRIGRVLATLSKHTSLPASVLSDQPRLRA